MAKKTVGKEVKSVAFQLQDPFEFELYWFAMQNKYFSTYMKRLLQRDFENNIADFDREACRKAYREFMESLGKEG